MPADLGEALRRHPEIIQYSRYDYQLSFWLTHFQPTQIKVLTLEDYVRHREERFAEVCEFLGLPSTSPPDGGAANRSDQMRVPLPVLRRFMQTNLYLRRIKPLLPEVAREWFKRILRRNPDLSGVTTNPEDVRTIRNGVHDDAMKFLDRWQLSHEDWDLRTNDLVAVRQPLASSSPIDRGER